MNPTTDLFAPPALLVRLDRNCDRLGPCCENLAFVRQGRGPHAAELRCANCGRHRGWMPKVALDFVAETAKRFGASTEPITLRDSTIGDHHMQKPQRDLSGVLFRNTSKGSPSQPDYRGEVTVAGTPYKLSAWIKDGANGKFMSLALTAKDAAKPAATATAANDFHSDEVPF